MKRAAAIIFLLLPLYASATTRNVTCSGVITSALQTALDASIDGDIVNLSAGTCSTAQVTWTNTDLTLQGQGIGTTILSFTQDTGMFVHATGSANFRITGFTLNLGAEDNVGAIRLNNDSTTEKTGFRIDHIRFNTTAAATTGLHRPITIEGLLYGVVDHCTFDMNHGTAGNSIDMWLNSEWPGVLGGTSWDKPLALGTDKAVYFEDNTFTFTQAATDQGGAFAIDGAYGMRVVFRHNTITNGYYMTHWLSGTRRGPMKNEIYENTFASNLGANVLPRPIWLLGGTGVIFNNTVTGSSWQTTNITLEDRRSCTGECAGLDAFDANITGETGWMCGDQIGVGGGALQAQTQVPLYVWNNTNMGVELQGNCDNPSLLSAHVKSTAHSNGAIDYCVGTTTMPSSCGTHTNTYSAYTYPHPVAAAGGSAPTISSIVCSPTTIQAPSGTSDCTTTATDAPYSYAYSFSSCTAASCSTSDTDSIATVGCTNGGPCTVCATATNGIGTSSQFCTAAGYLKSKYRKPSGLQAN